MNFQAIGFTALIALGVAGCVSTPKEEPAPAVPVKKIVAAPSSPSQSEVEARQLKEAADQMAAKSIFFDYDNFTVKSEYNNVLQLQAEILKRYNKIAVSVEGNADERGSSEYNLALGQKRAEAVRKALVILGVPDARIEAVSFGEEKPKAACPEEKCWSQNRRVDFSPKPQ